MMSDHLGAVARYAFAFAGGVWVTLLLWLAMTRSDGIGYLIG